MRRAPAATPRMRPEVRPRKLTRRSASPSAKVLRIMASVSRAGMKCRRDRLERGIRKVSGQAGRTCRTRLNTTGEDASQCWRGGVVEEMGEIERGRGQFSIRENLQVLLSMSARRHFGRLGMSCVHGKISAAPPGLGVVVLQTQCLRTGLTCLAPPALVGACRDVVERPRLGERKL